jgi:hypothetical protein
MWPSGVVVEEILLQLVFEVVKAIKIRAFNQVTI